MKFYLPLLLLIIIEFPAFTQTTRNIKNNNAINYAQFQRKAFSDTLVEITYDLPDSATYYKVGLMVIQKPDNDTLIIKPKGKYKYIRSGTERKYSWDGYNPSKMSMVTVFALPNKNRRELVSGITGLGLVVTGIIISSSASGNEDYQRYKENHDPTHPIWKDLGYESRGAVHDKYDKQYRTGQGLIIGGAAFITAAVLMYIDKRKSRSKSETVSRFEAIPMVLNTPIGDSIGLGIGVRFQF